FAQRAPPDLHNFCIDGWLTTESELDVWDGSDESRLAFFRHWGDFQRACPKLQLTVLQLDDGDRVAAEAELDLRQSALLRLAHIFERTEHRYKKYLQLLRYLDARQLVRLHLSGYVESTSLLVDAANDEDWKDILLPNLREIDYSAGQPLPEGLRMDTITPKAVKFYTSRFPELDRLNHE